MVEHVVLFFVDGLGVGPIDPEVNPMARVGGSCLNVFDDEEQRALGFEGLARPLDACLDLEGLPQSATGQTALLTGVNASQVLGRHLFGFPNQRLREIILDQSLLKRAREAGFTATFLNAFRPRFFELGDSVWTDIPLSVTTWTHHATGQDFFNLEDVAAGRSLYQEFTNRSLVRRGHDLPVFTADQAGAILARRCLDYNLVLFEYFRTDAIGHSQNMEKAEREIRHLEAFLHGFLSRVDPARVLLILSSDHGNIEDLSVRTHTRNKAMTILWGAEAATLAGRLRSITDVAGGILHTLTSTAG